MDNLTHTLVGAALGQAGLKNRTALGSATLMIGANFPDIDVIAVAFENSVHWRRGHTHGFLATAKNPNCGRSFRIACFRNRAAHGNAGTEIASCPLKSWA